MKNALSFFVKEQTENPETITGFGTLEIMLNRLGILKLRHSLFTV